MSDWSKALALSGWSSSDTNSGQCPLSSDSNIGHCLIMCFCEAYLNFGVTRVGPDNVRLKVSICGWLGVAWLDYFHFIHHAPLNSTVLLYSTNIKTTSSTWACTNIEPCHFTSFWLHENCHFWFCFAINSLEVVTWSTPHCMINFHFWHPSHFISWFNKDWHFVIYESP
jgi:hypothetical protein